MPINVRTNIINYKDPDTNQFVGVDAITDKTTAERVAAIEAAAGEQIELIEYYNSTITSPTTITRDDGLGLVVGLGTSSANVDALVALTEEVIDNICSSKVIRYDVPQYLTEEQKAHARMNIGIESGGGTSQEFNGERVQINDYTNEVIDCAQNDSPLYINVYIPEVENVIHSDLHIVLVNPNTGTQYNNEVTIYLTDLPTPFIEGWVELYEDGTIIAYPAPDYEAVTLDYRGAVLTAVAGYPFVVKASANNGDLDIETIDTVGYVLSTIKYVDKVMNEHLQQYHSSDV